MTRDRDWNVDMFRHRIDDATVERLFSGTLAPEDAPPGYGDVARLIRAVAGPVLPSELSQLPTVVAAGVAAVPVSETSEAASLRRRSMIKKAMTAKAAAIAAVALLGAGTAAAAATGNLPGQSHAAAHLTVTSGSNSPSSHHGSKTAPVKTTSGSIPTTGPANSHALFGLCTAFLAHHQTTTSTSNSGPDNSTAFKDLIAETGGSVAATTSFCQTYVQANHPGKPSNTGKPSDTGKPSNTGKPASPGSSASHSNATSSSQSSGSGASTHISGNASTTGAGTATSRSN